MRFWYFPHYREDGWCIAISPKVQINLLVGWMLLVVGALIAIAVGVWVR